MEECKSNGLCQHFVLVGGKSVAFALLKRLMMRYSVSGKRFFRQSQREDMKKIVVIMACLSCLGLGAVSRSIPVRAEVIDKIVAILGDEVILLSEVLEYAEKPVVQVVAAIGNSGDIEQTTLRYMIERQLLAQEIQYLAFPRGKEVVRSLALQYIVNTYHQQDIQAFEKNVRAYGVTEAELEQELDVYMKGIDYIRRKYRFSEDVENPQRVLKLFQAWLEELRNQTDIVILL
jgi:hypothetical protein